ncbi:MULTISPECIES: hypothetical protein [unclassified Streptomyces]|uniref:hypothetical protein n=1 Tax=unclassified Streptomyces TaxID=2593676 RepID=UPI002E8103F0|nr:hypothetical protein [Streptomyces sp. NBC_00562]WUC23180.1 hypothetical protein OHA33_32375 [Streptomyces sp. NBC_00562]
MSSFMKRTCIAITSVVMAGGAIVGTGAGASAATSENVQRPANTVAADNHPSDRDHDYCWDRRDGHRQKPGGVALLEAPAQDIKKFLQETEAHVPIGSESERIDSDALLRHLLAKD